MGYAPSQQILSKVQRPIFECPACDMPVWNPGFLDRPLQWSRQVSPYWADAFIVLMIFIGLVMFSFYFPPTRFAWEMIINIFKIAWQTTKREK